jgi:hypothetical protein
MAVAKSPNCAVQSLCQHTVSTHGSNQDSLAETGVAGLAPKAITGEVLRQVGDITCVYPPPLLPPKVYADHLQGFHDWMDTIPAPCNDTSMYCHCTASTTPSTLTQHCTTNPVPPMYC